MKVRIAPAGSPGRVSSTIEQDCLDLLKVYVDAIARHKGIPLRDAREAVALDPVGAARMCSRSVEWVTEHLSENR